MHAHAQLCYWPHFDWEVEIDFMGRIMYKLPESSTDLVLGLITFSIVD